MRLLTHPFGISVFRYVEVKNKFLICKEYCTEMLFLENILYQKVFFQKNTISLHKNTVQKNQIFNTFKQLIITILNTIFSIFQIGKLLNRKEYWCE